MSDFDDLLAKVYSAAGDEPAPKPAPSMDADVAALLGRTPASAERTPAPPEGARADVAALTGKSPAPAPAPGFLDRAGDAVKYGVNLASTAAGNVADVLNKEGLVRDPQTGEWVVDEKAEVEDSRPWYRKAAGAIGSVLDEGVLPWAKRQGEEVVKAAPTAAANFANAVTLGTAPALIEGYGNLFHSFEDSPESKQPVHTEAQMQQEAAARNAEHPTAATLGDVAGSAYLSAITGPRAGASKFAKVAGDTMSSVGQYLARNITGQDAKQPWKQRINAGMKQATEDPLAFSSAVALPALAEGAQTGLGAVARGTSDASKDAFSHLFLPAQQRALLKKAGGDQAIRKLVSEVQDEGILGGAVPTANSVARRAGQVIEKTGPEIGKQLDDMLAASKQHGGTVSTGSLLKTLQDAQDWLVLHGVTDEADPEIAYLQSTIDRLKARAKQGGPADVMDLERANGVLKYFQDRTKFDPTAAPREGYKKGVNLAGWKGMKDATAQGFEDLETQGHLPPGTYDKYKDAQKSYHTAQTVHYPALQVSEKIAQASGADPKSLLGAALLGGQFGAPAAIGVSLGGVPRGLSGRVLQGVSGVAKGGQALTELSDKLRIPAGAGGQLASYAKEANEEARRQVRKTRADRERRARASNELEAALKNVVK